MKKWGKVLGITTGSCEVMLVEPQEKDMSQDSDDLKKYTWARKHENGYEMSSKGNKAFSAFYAMMPDGKTIEHHYQCNIKGYNSIREGKGKLPLNEGVNLWESYLNLWRTWSIDNMELIQAAHEYFVADNINVFTDMFATTEVNQAHALSVIFNELFYK